MHPGERVMALADFSDIPAGTKGIIMKIYDGGVMVEWELDEDQHGRTANPVLGRIRDDFSTDELEYLAFETKMKPNSLQP